MSDYGDNLKVDCYYLIKNSLYNDLYFLVVSVKMPIQTAFAVQLHCMFNLKRFYLFIFNLITMFVKQRFCFILKKKNREAFMGIVQI